MGISCITRNTYSIIPLLLIILFGISSSSSFSPTDIVTKELLNELCSQPTILNPRFCLTWLTADHRTMSMTIHGLIELTFNKTRAFGLKNLALMSDFARGSGDDKQLKNAYESCVESYGIAIKELESANEFLRNSSFQLAFYAATKTLEYGSSCNDQFDGPSTEPYLILQRNDRFLRMSHTARDFVGLFY